MHTILLFYKYVYIQYPKSIMKQQRALCETLGLKGRIILAHEGINATLGGTAHAVNAYKEYMNNHELFRNIDFKESVGEENAFPRLRVVVKHEIVHLGLDPEKVTVKDGGEHLTPEQAHALMEQNPDDLIILDARNNYESRIGTFKNSLTPNIKNFREFPDYVDTNLEQFKNKQVLMHCTGGIRCERASAYLNQKGVAKKVYQIEGGIHRYIEKYPQGFFRGKNYVFDGRVTVRVNDDILTTCDWCKKPADDYTNCMNAQCNSHFIACVDCVKEHGNVCCIACKEKIVQKKVPLRKKPIPGVYREL
jgi:predicted sulfurtransferase